MDSNVQDGHISSTALIASGFQTFTLVESSAVLLEEVKKGKAEVEALKFNSYSQSREIRTAARQVAQRNTIIQDADGKAMLAQLILEEIGIYD